ncbi:MAG: 6-phosphofructokinase [Acidimicrobiales bacterium]|jgi:6-phosphofructokinase 1
MRIGLLTGGGDCPGLNAVIRAVVVGGSVRHGDEAVGFLDGWRGVIEGDSTPLDTDRCRHILTLGGTILGSSRTNPFATEDGPARALATAADLELDAVVAIGGDDTLGAADRLFALGLPVVGVPKTIDNDLSGTEVTFGFDTAVQIATEAIDRLQTTAESHHRVMVCEVMGRNVGHIAVHAGVAGGAAEILIPEVPFSLDEVCDHLRVRHAGGRYFSTVVVAEGALPAEPAAADQARGARSQAGGTDQFGHGRLGGIGSYLAEEIERITGYEARATVLGHIQRGGSPSAFDRVLATRFGAGALEAVHDGAFGTMVALQAGKIVRVPLADAAGNPKKVDPHLYRMVARLYLG